MVSVGLFPWTGALLLQQTRLPLGICMSWKLLALWIDRGGEWACSASSYCLPQSSWTLVSCVMELRLIKEVSLGWFFPPSTHWIILFPGVNCHISKVCTSSDVPAGSWAASVPAAAAIATTKNSWLALALLVFLQCRNRQWAHGVVQKYYWFPVLA